MSGIVERGLRRQRAIQQSRSAAWVMLVFVLIIALSSLLSLIATVVTGTAFSLIAFVSLVVLISTVWVSGHLYRETRRLGNLLKDPEALMRAEQNPDLVSGAHWSVLNPFSNWRD